MCFKDIFRTMDILMDARKDTDGESFVNFLVRVKNNLPT